MVKQPAKPRGQAFWPIMGFFLIAAFGTLSYFVTPAAVSFLSNTLPNFPPPGVKPDTWNWVVGGTLFIVMVMLASLVVAAAAPKRKAKVDEKALARERMETITYRKAAKLRQNAINREQQRVNAGH